MNKIAPLLFCGITIASFQQKPPESAYTMNQNSISNRIESRLTGREKVSLEELVNALPPDDRAKAIRSGAERGIFVFTPDFLSVVDDPVLKLEFLKRLREPLENRFLVKIAAVIEAETNDSLKLQYAALLYRYNIPSGAVMLRRMLVGSGQTAVRQNVALIFALNKEDEYAGDVRQALAEITEFDPQLSAALARWDHPAIQELIKTRFHQNAVNAGFALAVSIRRDSRLEGRAEAGFRAAREWSRQKLGFATALASLSAEPRNLGVDYLMEQLENPSPPHQQWPVWVVEALTFCAGAWAEDTLVKLVIEELPRVKPKEPEVFRQMVSVAAVGLSLRLNNETEAALLDLIERGGVHYLSPEQKYWFSLNVLRSNRDKLVAALRNALQSQDAERFERTTNLKDLPYEMLPMGN